MTRRLVPVGLLIAALAAAGCGSAGSSTSQPQQQTSTTPKVNFVELAAKSAARAQAAGSAHVTIAMASHVAGSTEGFAMNGSGDVSFRPLLESLTLTMNSPTPQLNGTMREIMTGTKLYMNWPLLSAQIPGHKPWMEEDLGALGAAMGMNVSGMLNQSSGSASQMLSYLKGVSTMRVVGPATIDGAATTEYSGTIDYSKLAASGLITRKAFGLLRTEMGGTTVPFKLWLDGNDMVRRMRENLSMTTANGPTLLMHMQIGFSRFGEKVHVTAPPASQVFDANKLVASAASGAGSSS